MPTAPRAKFRRLFRSHGRRIWRKFGEKTVLIFVLQFAGNWPQEISPVNRHSRFEVSKFACFFFFTGASRSGLVLPDFSFLILVGTFPIFPGVSRSFWGSSQFFLFLVLGLLKAPTSETQKALPSEISKFSRSQEKAPCCLAAILDSQLPLPRLIGRHLAQRAQGLKKFDRGLRDRKIRAIDRELKFSIEPFPVHQQGPENGNPRIENFKPGLKFSIGIQFFRSQGPLAGLQNETAPKSI